MALRIEFLQSKDDVHSFVAFIYTNGYHIRHRNPQKCNDILSIDRAANALCGDLFGPGNTYYIGKGNDKDLLGLVSCGRQGHPRNLGKWGRIAGVITCEDKGNAEAYYVFKLIKSFFRRTYIYQRYNGNARMSCFWGPNYLRLDKEFLEKPEPKETIPGFLRITCLPEQQRMVSMLIEDICLANQAIRISSSEWNQYWRDPELLEARTEFLCDSTQIDWDKFVSLALIIAGNTKMTNMRNSRRCMSASADWPLSYLRENKYRNMSFVIENPFSSSASPT